MSTVGFAGQLKRCEVVCGPVWHFVHRSGIASSSLWLYELRILLYPDLSCDKVDRISRGMVEASLWMSGGAQPSTLLGG